jgi:fermentation-respiration switch protein FrsA (DUF1100 family)
MADRRDVDVTVDSAGERLAGTLTLPHGAGPFPAALLLPGSGPIDRDSNHRRLRLGITGQLGEALAAAGIGSLRYDKRGAGASTGSFLAAGLHHNIDDAAAALAFLAARPEVDAGRISLVGHSEGAIIAARLAAHEPFVSAVVLLAGAARPGAETLRWQAERIVPTLPAFVRGILRATRTDLVAKVLKNHDRIRRTTRDVVRMGGVRVNARWTREFLDHDPGADLARIRVPVLAVTGTKDLQVDPADLARIADLVPGPVEAHRIPDLSHILRRQAGPPSLRAYRRDARQPVDAEVTDLVTRWLARQPAPGPIHPAGPGMV